MARSNSAESVTARSSDAASGKIARVAVLLADYDSSPRPVAVRGHGQRVATRLRRHRQPDQRRLRVPARGPEAPADRLRVGRDTDAQDPAVRLERVLEEVDVPEPDSERARRAGRVAGQVLRREREPVVAGA